MVCTESVVQLTHIQPKIEHKRLTGDCNIAGRCHFSAHILGSGGVSAWVVHGYRLNNESAVNLCLFSLRINLHALCRLHCLTLLQPTSVTLPWLLWLLLSRVRLKFLHTIRFSPSNFRCWPALCHTIQLQTLTLARFNVFRLTYKCRHEFTGCNLQQFSALPCFAMWSSLHTVTGIKINKIATSIESKIDAILYLPQHKNK